MALNPTLLATTFLSQYKSAGKLEGMDTAAENQLKADWEFFFDLLVDHITTYAVISSTVTTTVTGTSVSGGAVTGTGTGTATGTIS